MAKIKNNHYKANTYFYAVIGIWSIVLLTFIGVLAKEANKTFMPHHSLLFYVFASGIIALIIAGFVLSIRQIFLNFLFLRALNNSSQRPNRSMQNALRELNLQKEIRLIEATRKFCFTSGIIFPKIFISSALVKNLTKSEFKALLWHEFYHLKHRDPVKILFCRILQKVFLFLPIVNHIAIRYDAYRELAADAFVIEKTKTKKHLAALFAKILAGNQEGWEVKPLAFSANFNDGLNERLSELVEKRSEHNQSLFRPLFLSLFILGFLFFLPDFSALAIHFSPKLVDPNLLENGALNPEVMHNIDP